MQANSRIMVKYQKPPPPPAHPPLPTLEQVAGFCLFTQKKCDKYHLMNKYDNNR